jgi:ribosomal protein S13
VRYGVVCESMKANGEACRAEAAYRVGKGTLFDITYDNLVRTDAKEEETIFNKKSLIQSTSGYIHFLHVPKPAEGAPDWMVNAYEAIVLAKELDPGCGAPKDLMLLRNPDYHSISGWDFLAPESISKHYETISRVHITDILWRFMGDFAMQSFTEGPEDEPLQRPTMPTTGDYYCIEPHRSELYTFPVMELDETTIDGTAKILEAIGRDLDIELEQLIDRHVDIHGDNLTNRNIRALKELRVRDNTAARMEFTSVKSGLLHVLMAQVDSIFRCHMGRPDGRDPGSLARFIGVLGRTRVNAKVQDFNACLRFQLQVLEGYILAALIQACDRRSRASSGKPVTDVAEMKAWVSRNDWRKIVFDVMSEFMLLRSVPYQRSIAREKAKQQYDSKRATVMAKGKGQRSKSDNELKSKKGETKFVNAETLKHRDIVYENAVLLIQDLLILRDLHGAARAGHTGRVSKDLEILTLLFAGTFIIRGARVNVQN